MGLMAKFAKFKNSMDQKANEKLEKRLVNLLKKLESSPRYKKLGKKPDDIAIAINTEITTPKDRGNFELLSEHALWFSEETTVEKTVKNHILLTFPIKEKFNSANIKDWDDLESAVFDPNNWNLLKFEKPAPRTHEFDIYKHFFGNRNPLKGFLTVYFSKQLGINPPNLVTGVARDIGKGMQRGAEKIVQKGEDLKNKMGDKREGVRQKFKRLRGSGDGLKKEKERAKALVNWCKVFKSFGPEFMWIEQKSRAYFGQCADLVKEDVKKEYFGDRGKLSSDWSSGKVAELKDLLISQEITFQLNNFMELCKYPYKNREEITKLAGVVREKTIKNVREKIQNCKEEIEKTFKKVIDTVNKNRKEGAPAATPPPKFDDTFNKWLQKLRGVKAQFDLTYSDL